MKPLYTELQFSKAKSQDKLKCQCYKCNNSFFITKSLISQELKQNRGRCKYCTKNCTDSMRRTQKILSCTNCTKKISKQLKEFKKSSNHFCSQSCSATYNNKNKTHGTRRSKLEVYLESKLTEFYPDLVIHFNQKDTIGSELDIYFPTLKLAIELNGIFHYEPIYGNKKLDQIQNNDSNKFQRCQELGISLCIIDVSSLSYFKEASARKYLDIICQILSHHH